MTDLKCICTNCENEEATNRYKMYKNGKIYELDLCFVCNNLFRQDLIKENNNFNVMKRYGAQERLPGKLESLTIPGGVIRCDYGFKDRKEN